MLRARARAQFFFSFLEYSKKTRAGMAFIVSFSPHTPDGIDPEGRKSTVLPTGPVGPSPRPSDFTS